MNGSTNASSTVTNSASYPLDNTGMEVQEAITASLGPIPSRISSLESNKVDKVAGKNLSTNDYITGDKDKVNKIIINGNGSSFLSNDGDYKTIGQTIEYPDLLIKPVLNTDNDITQSVSSVETIEGTIKLHKISKTGSYSDLIGLPTIPNITLNGTQSTSSNFYAPIDAGESGCYLKSLGSDSAPVWESVFIPAITLNGARITNPTLYAPTSGGIENQYLKSNGSGAPTWATFPSIPSVGTLNTTATSSQEISLEESFGGNVTLHKISKTGSYSDLIGKPIIPAITLNGARITNPTLYAPTSGGTSGQILKSNGSSAPTWGLISYDEVSGTPEIPSVTLNGINTSSSNFYAPISAGTSGQILSSTGTGAPMWKTMNYNDSTNRPIINQVGTSSIPVVIGSLSNGLYNVSGYYKNTVSDTNAIEIVGNMFVDKFSTATDSKATMITKNNIEVAESVINSGAWVTTKYKMPKADFEYIKLVYDYPAVQDENVLYMKIEEV